ncbi:MAG: hypothetical protein EPO55_14760 [Reyranella sp.]|uniref:transposase n=1 Tax=Reyranella sp. TaxID=1929291 RepID=UPI0011FFBDA6|nr:transposase [Reyranella sp.]TAJ38742.1 MAG: hypothetical protein EPO55_14760 [Reyranella sp.]
MKYRYSAAFRRQAVEEIPSGEQTATMQARRHGISRAVIYDWIAKYRLSGLPSDRRQRGARRERRAGRDPLRRGDVPPRPDGQSLRGDGSGGR